MQLRSRISLKRRNTFSYIHIYIYVHHFKERTKPPLCGNAEFPKPELSTPPTAMSVDVWATKKHLRIISNNSRINCVTKFRNFEMSGSRTLLHRHMHVLAPPFSIWFRSIIVFLLFFACQKFTWQLRTIAVAHGSQWHVLCAANHSKALAKGPHVACQTPFFPNICDSSRLDSAQLDS